MKLGAVMEQLAQDLNDAAVGHEFTAWTYEQIRGYLLEGLQTVSEKRPDLFSKRVVLQVTPCTTVQDLCDCDKILDVLGQSTKEGRVFKTLRRRSNDPRVQWPGKRCPIPARKNFQLDEYAINTATGGLELFPPAPPGQDLYVVVECSLKPELLTEESEINEAAIPAALQWVLYRAKMVDAENNPAVLAAARTHQDTCFTLLSAAWKYQKPKDGDSP